MTKLSARKTRLVFSTADEVYEAGRRRQVVIEAHPGYCTVKLGGLRTAFPVAWGSIYSLAVKQAVREAAKAKKAGRK